MVFLFDSVSVRNGLLFGVDVVRLSFLMLLLKLLEC